MNAKQLLAAALTLATASVFAQGAAPAGQSREQVKAELLRAQGAGELVRTEADLDVAKSGRQGAPGLTREQVKAEFLRAQAAGELQRTEADMDVTRAPAAKSGLTRAEVMAEFRRARAAGELVRSEADLDVAHTRVLVQRNN